ncbi:MAG: DUF4019 domain-containing protein [Nitrospiraceae bacterium]|nr:DUF4019 domain-containing protein [Nitrospiraceae bacterium]
MKVLTRMLFIAVSLSLLAGIAAAERPERMAMTAAEEWLRLVDKGEYAKSWREASSLFKAGGAEEEWIRTVASVRKPFGKVLRRAVKSMQYTKTLPGAPDGEYVVIVYDTSFKKKKSSVETITPMLDKDGKWRVSGYYIR